MADNTTNVALNIGSQRVSMAVFEPKSGGITLKAFASRELLADPATEALRMPQTRQAISDLAQQLKIKGGKVRYAVSGQTVFTRIVKLPPIEVDDVKSLVTMEAQQQLPFPIDTVVWDYSMIEGSAEKEVAIVAIKSDALDEINSTIASTNLGTSQVDAAPMALFNAYRHSYSDIAEPVLLIDIGAKASNLIYIEGKRFFIRTIPIGGVSLTTAIAKEYGIPFGEAEGQKTTNGLITLGGGHTAQLDESVAALGTVLRNALGRLPQEITRTTNLYRSQHGGNAPRRIFLAGGGASLPYTKEFFEEKLSLPVEFFNPYRNVGIGKNVNQETIQKEAHTMGELVGLGLRGAGKAAVNIDLVPSVVEADRASARRRPKLLAAAAILIGGFAAFAGLGMARNSKAEKKLADGQAQNADLAITADPLKNLLDQQTATEKQTKPLTDAQIDRNFWNGILNDLSTHFASEYVWITDMEPLANYNPTLVTSAKDSGKNGDSIVRAEFATGLNPGTSALNKNITAAAAPGAKPAIGNPNVEFIPSANAIRLRGQAWRANKDGSKIVYDLLEKLKASKSPNFNFKAKDPSGKEIELKNEQLVKKLDAATDAQTEYAWQYEIILPLARPVTSR